MSNPFLNSENNQEPTPQQNTYNPQQPFYKQAQAQPHYQQPTNPTQYREPAQPQRTYDIVSTNEADVLQGEVVTDQDLDKIKHEVSARIKNSPEVQRLANDIDVSNPQSVLKFGQQAAEGISRYADSILANTSQVSVNERGTMLKDLSKIMKNFDMEDFTKEPKKPSFLQKITGKAQNQLEKVLAKYKTMDGEIQNIYVQLKEYEREIETSNRNMEQMTQGVLEYYNDLEKHIQAGNHIKTTAELEWIPAIESEISRNQSDMMLPQQLSNANDFIELIDQRLQDLQMAQFVALQTLPQIKMAQKGNNLLVGKINSAFVITLPVFKLGLSQAITAKRQRIQAESMEALDETTNELLKRTAQNSVANAKHIAQLSGTASVKIETLQETFNTIMEGINEVQRIETDNKQSREQNRRSLEQLTTEMKNKNF